MPAGLLSEDGLDLLEVCHETRGRDFHHGAGDGLQRPTPGELRSQPR